MTKSNFVINLTAQDRITTSTSSKGDQIKWFKDGYWYKSNHLGYEDLAEYVAFRILALSTLHPSSYIQYRLAEVHENGVRHSVSVSENFLSNGDILIPIGRLIKQRGIDVDSLRGKPMEYQIEFILNMVYSITGLNLTSYFQVVFTLDAFILNEDRHFFNLAVIYNKPTNTYRYCPIFDNGLSLLSDLKDYPLDVPLSLNINSVQAKPFSLGFDKQLGYFGLGMRIDGSQLQHFINTEREQLGRIADVLEYQMNKYRGTIIV